MGFGRFLRQDRVQRGWPIDDILRHLPTMTERVLGDLYVLLFRKKLTMNADTQTMNIDRYAILFENHSVLNLYRMLTWTE